MQFLVSCSKEGHSSGTRLQALPPPPPPSPPARLEKKSRRGLKILAIVIVILLVAGVLVGYSYTQITTSVKSVEVSGATFREPSLATLASLLTGNIAGVALSLLDSIILQVDLEVGNGGLLPVIIPSVEFDFSINGVSAGSGRSDSSYTLNSRQLQAIPIRVDVPATRLQPMISSIVSSMGELDVVVRGKLKANLIGIPLDIPFETTQRVSLRQVAEEKARAWASRLAGGAGAAPTDFSIVSYKWTVGGREVTVASPGSNVIAMLVIRAEKRFGYTVSLEVRQDRVALPDVSFGTRSYSLVMQPGEVKELSMIFVAQGGLTVRGYFISLRWEGQQWQMPAQYPPRLSVK